MALPVHAFGRVVSHVQPRPRRAAAWLGWVLALALLALAAGPGFAASLTGTADRTSLVAGETVEFVLALTGGDGREPPDLAPLARDFDIMGQGRRSRGMLVDGKRVQVNEWVLTLAPKRAGKVTIPPLTVAGLASAPVPLQVVPAATNAEVEDRPLFIRIEAGDVSPFVQSEVPVSVRIYDSVGLRPGSSWTKPTAQGATFVEQGDQRSYIRTIGKQRYRVSEQGYLMRPQKSGPIEIEPVTLNAKVPGYSGSSPTQDMSYLLGRGGVRTPWLNNTPDFARDLTLKSNAVTVNVQERPADAAGWFLPARGVTLSSSWSPPLASAKVGETLTRTLRLEARGAAVNQLPPLVPADVAGVRQYEESSRSQSISIQGEPGAALTKTISVVPTRTGEVTLPAMEVTWWNTATKTPATTVLPAETFQVQPGVAAAPAPPPAAANGAASPPPPASVETEPPVPAPSLTERLLALMGLLSRDRLVGLILVLGGLLGLGLVVARLRRGRRTRRTAPATETARGRPPIPARMASRPAPARAVVAPLRTLAAAEAALLAACKADDAGAAHRAVLAWMKLAPAVSPGRAHSLGTDDLATAEMARAVEDLRGHLYGGTPGSWKGGPLRAALRREHQARRRLQKTPRRARLAPLYPHAG